MIKDVIDTFRNTTPAVNQKFVRKNQSQGLIPKNDFSADKAI